MGDTILLKCHNCHHEWDYRGKSLHYATCPKCRFKVKIRLEYLCPYCNENRSSPRELRRHIGKAHKEKVDDFAFDYKGGRTIVPRRMPS